MVGVGGIKGLVGSAGWVSGDQEFCWDWGGGQAGSTAALGVLGWLAGPIWENQADKWVCRGDREYQGGKQGLQWGSRGSGEQVDSVVGIRGIKRDYGVCEGNWWGPAGFSGVGGQAGSAGSLAV